MAEGLTRRDALRGAGGVALAVFVAGDGTALGVELRTDARFLSDAELTTLRAAVDAFVPADADPGALAAGCAEGIDALLGAFRTKPPRIYAGGPFSDRAGADTNDFARFTPLDPYEAKAWRLRIEGSRGRRKLEFNGPVKGLQQTYREGLAALRAGGFDTAPAPAREAMLRGDDPAVRAFVDVAFPHTLQLIYGAPEYGGNRDLVGWSYTNYDGDVQPRGWTAAEVAEAVPGLLGGRRAAGPLPPLLALASADLAHGIMARSGHSLSALEAEIAPILKRDARAG